MKKYLFLLGFIVSVLFAQAQTRNCGTMQHLEEIRQNDPQVDQRMQLEESAIQHWITNNPESVTSSIITIPVVVHVIYKTATQNISTAQVQSQIDILNEDFRKLNADASSVPAGFSGVAADCQIEFCLAVRDPNGNTTTGITRTSTTVSSFSGYTSMKYASSGGHDAWNTSKYLNIWVCNLASGLLGFATFPGGNSSTDGVVCDYAYFGDIGTATAPYHLGRTATHEVGHWLNLYHIWGDSNCGNDYVSDTPTQEGSNYGCPNYPSPSNCSGNGSYGDMFMNYMDYTNDACMYMFTTGQKTRMRATLNGSRSSLLTSNGCVPVNVPIVLNASITNVSCYGGNDGAIDLNVSGGLSPFSYSWSTGATTQDITNLSAGTYTVSVTDAQGQVQTTSYTVTAPTAISISYNAVSTSAPGNSDGAIYTTSTGGTPPYTYYWVSPYATTQNLIGIPSGTYTFYTIDANGCFASATIVVSDGVLTPITATATITNMSCNGDGNGAIDVSVSGGMPPFTYSWSNGAATQDLYNLNGGNYTLTITDAQNQTYSATYAVIEPDSITITYSVTNVSAAGGNDGAIDITPTGGVPPYTYYWSTNPTQNTQDVSGLSAGTYTVWVVDANGCYNDAVITVSENTNTTCGVVTGLHTTNLIHDRVTINWDNMNTANCVVDQYRIKYRVVGTSSWSNKTMGAPVGSCNTGLNKTDKLTLNLTPNTQYEYIMKVWYCGASASGWTAAHYFTTLSECPNITNLTATPLTSTKVRFDWALNGVYDFVRIKLREDYAGTLWFNAGGFGINYPAITKNKNGLSPGTPYRAVARTWCDPNGGAYRSASWTSAVFWTQPTIARLGIITEKELVRITDLLGRTIKPNEVVNHTTVLYMYDDGTIEKRIIVK